MKPAKSKKVLLWVLTDGSGIYWMGSSSSSCRTRLKEFANQKTFVKKLQIVKLQGEYK